MNTPFTACDRGSILLDAITALMILTIVLVVTANLMAAAAELADSLHGSVSSALTRRTELTERVNDALIRLW